jgi:hypothetical protein
MAAEIQVLHDQTGETLYAVVRNAGGQCWNTSGTPAFEARTVANWANYKIALTETPASSYFYVGTFPAAIAAGFYWLDIYVQGGGAALVTDFRVESQLGYWDGSAFSQQEAADHILGDTTELLTRMPDATPGTVGGLPVLSSQTYFWIGDGGTSSYETLACYLLNGATPAALPTDGDYLIVNPSTPGWIMHPLEGSLPMGVRAHFLYTINYGTVGMYAHFWRSTNMGTVGDFAVFDNGDNYSPGVVGD